MWIFYCSQVANTCSKLTLKKIRLMCMCSSLKINTSSHCSFVFVVDFDHSQHINIVFLLLTLNKCLFYNVLKTLFEGLFHLAICQCIKLKQITTTLSAYYDMNIVWAYVLALNMLWESQANNPRFVSLFDLLYHRYFPEI